VEAKGKSYWIGWAFSVLPSLVFLLSAIFKLRGGAEVEQGFAHLGLPLTLMKPLAVLELSCVVVYLIPATSVLGAILLAGYLGGAICTHLRVGDPFVAQAAIGVFLWLGLWLRESRLRVLIPLRRGGPET
jgi:hypothetical protein